MPADRASPWDLSVVLARLRRALFVPLDSGELKFLSFKTSIKRVGFVLSMVRFLVNTCLFLDSSAVSPVIFRNQLASTWAINSRNSSDCDSFSVNIMLNVTDWKGTYWLYYVNLVLWRLHLSCHKPELRWMPGCFLSFSAQTWMSGCMPPSYIPVCTGSGLPCKFHWPIFIGHFLVMFRGVWGSQVSSLMSVST